MYEGSVGTINLAASNYAVSERLDGNFHYPWQFTFWPPLWFPDYSAQALWFTVENPPDSVGHFADYTVRMDLDTSYINDTLQILNANVQFSDSLGYILYLYEINISPIVINDITAIDEEVDIPDGISISRVYPNPFNSSTTIRFTLPESQNMKLSIYDLLGRQVETLVDEEMQAGRHQVVWDASEYSSGVYFYRIEAGDFAETKKMILLK
jgi:hypothetical protein